MSAGDPPPSPELRPESKSERALRLAKADWEYLRTATRERFASELSDEAARKIQRAYLAIAVGWPASFLVLFTTRVRHRRVPPGIWGKFVQLGIPLQFAALVMIALLQVKRPSLAGLTDANAALPDAPGSDSAGTRFTRHVGSDLALRGFCGIGAFAFSLAQLGVLSSGSFLDSPANAVRAAGPTAGPPHALAHLVEPHRDALLSGLLFFGGSDPADPLVPRQRRDVRPHAPGDRVGSDRLL
jgi:hypothetical protein